MKLGIVLPQDIVDPVALRDFVQAIDEMGFDRIGFPDHVIGANPASHVINGPYTHESFFHELIATMGFVAAVTRNVRLMSDVAILPQRQAGLFAKQMAALDVLSGGRVIAGIGGGWNQVEFDVLGMDFANRGKRLDEQVAVLRALWCNDLVDFDGQFHRIVDAGINPLPVQRPIPIWFGGWSDVMIRRIARSGDGWVLYNLLEHGAAERVEKLRQTCAEVGRNPDEIAIVSWIFLNRSDVMAGADQAADAARPRSPEEWIAEARQWQGLGVSHIDCWTMYGDYTVDQHIALAREFRDAMASFG